MSPLCPYVVKIFFSSYDLDTWHAYGAQAINDDPHLTLTYFTASSNLVNYVFERLKLLQSHKMGTCSK